MAGDRGVRELDRAVLDALFEAAVDGILVADRQGTIARANAAAGRLFGHRADALVGQNVRVLMPDEEAMAHDGHIARHLETGLARIIGAGREVEGARQDGSRFPLHLSVGRVEHGDEVLFIGILRDLTRQRATEAALARSQRLDAIGQMTGGVAHDFNNILTVMIGNLELAMAKAGTATAPLLADALEAAETGADLTRRLLTFARKGDLSPRPVSLPEECEAAVAILRRTLAANIRIEQRHAAGLPSVEVDPVQLQTALLNLAFNARDAMPEGGRLLFETESAVIDDDYIAQETDIVLGRYVRLSVSDTGLGMGPVAQRRAFEPFFTTKPAGKGTGLGLSLVYGFVRQSGGHVTLYSEPGQGTTVGIYLPIGTAAQDGAADPVHERNLPRGRGEVVLVVEDNDKVRQLSVTRLTELGYQPLEAETGDAAIALLDELGSVDVLFTDIVMPGSRDGFALAAEVAARFPSIRIVLTSGYASDVLVPASGRPRHPMLRKPYRLGDLARTLADALGGP